MDKAIQTNKEDDENTDKYVISADPSKYVTLPVQHEKIWRKYQNTLEWFWTAHDVYLANDLENMMTIFDEEQRHCIIKLITFMFATHHTTINKELFMQFINQVDIKEASYYFGSQADAKKTHSMMYSMLLDELLQGGQVKKEKLISQVVATPSVRSFMRWSIQSTLSTTKSFAQRLLALATVQGIIFSGPFLLFKWIHKKHPSSMPGLNKSNEYISRDEKLNLSFSCMLFEYIEDGVTEEEAHEIVKDAVLHAKCLLTQTFPVSKFGLKSEYIEQYIEYCADKILSDIKISKIYNRECPFDWVEEPNTDTYQSKVSMNNVVDMSASFGEAKFSTDLDF